MDHIDSKSMQPSETLGLLAKNEEEERGGGKADEADKEMPGWNLGRFMDRLSHSRRRFPSFPVPERKSLEQSFPVSGTDR